MTIGYTTSDLNELLLYIAWIIVHTCVYTGIYVLILFLFTSTASECPNATTPTVGGQFTINLHI